MSYIVKYIFKFRRVIMEVKLRELNGSYYLLIKKEVKDMMEIGDTVKTTIKDNKIIIEKLEKAEKK